MGRIADSFGYSEEGQLASRYLAESHRSARQTLHHWNVESPQSELWQATLVLQVSQALWVSRPTTERHEDISDGRRGVDPLAFDGWRRGEWSAGWLCARQRSCRSKSFDW